MQTALNTGIFINQDDEITNDKLKCWIEKYNDCRDVWLSEYFINRHESFADSRIVFSTYNYRDILKDNTIDKSYKKRQRLVLDISKKDRK